MRRLVWFAAGFVPGLYLAQELVRADRLLYAGILCAALSAAAMALPERLRRRLVLLLTGAALCCGWQWLYIRQVQQPMEALADTVQTAELTLCGTPKACRYGAGAEARIKGLQGKILYYGDAALLEQQPGTAVTATVAFSGAAGMEDADENLFPSKGVFLLAYAQGEAHYSPGVMPLPLRLQGTLQRRIEALFEGDEGALLRALLTGDPSRLSTQARTDLSEAGLYHVLAVSGMHCAYLLALVGFLAGPYRSHLAFPALILFALTVGASPSVVRACIMLSFLCAAPLFRREHDPPTALAAAALLIVLHNPYAVRSVSMQLSFGAVIGLLWLTPKLRALLRGTRVHGRVYSFVADSVSATAGALLCTAPLTAAYFGRLVLVGFLSNLLCLWLVGVLFIAGLAAVCASALWAPLGAAAALLPRFAARLLLNLSHALAALPGHAVYTVNPLVIYALALIYLHFFLAWRARRRRGYAAALLCAVLTLTAAVRLNQGRYTAPLEVFVLDVGQGQCVLLKSGDVCALADCGSSNSRYDPGNTAADWLLTLGNRRLDYLLLTHFDSDHINGVETLLARISVDRLLVPEVTDEAAALAERCGAELLPIGRNVSLPLGAAALRVFPPLGAEDDNERGLSLLAAANGEALFLSGDMSAETERLLLERYDLPELKVLIAGHHGSKSAVSAELLRTTEPEITCISVGKNAYGHPAAETLERLSAHGCTVCRTDLQGTLHFALGAN